VAEGRKEYGRNIERKDRQGSELEYVVVAATTCVNNRIHIYPLKTNQPSLKYCYSICSEVGVVAKLAQYNNLGSVLLVLLNLC
jgi:hypothetical protein